ncbi:hypothetical protein BofuT4_P052260.1 [Botrytis cinerea T4]|uniref:Uncharacterized protein n=1 Tax=Botryotinia fuckeliana (strain T4) TaxID=999810 RepID=G2XWK7_BOTF4|nr:hypothetical protein BofuT4_P052260.1 [Botrytis cinerea T4]
MSQNAIETPPSLPDVLAQNITCIKKGECELDLPSSFSFGPRIVGGLVMSLHPPPHHRKRPALDLLPNALPPHQFPTRAIPSQIFRAPRPPIPQHPRSKAHPLALLHKFHKRIPQFPPRHLLSHSR